MDSRKPRCCKLLRPSQLYMYEHSYVQVDSLAELCLPSARVSLRTVDAGSFILVHGGTWAPRQHHSCPIHASPSSSSSPRIRLCLAPSESLGKPSKGTTAVQAAPGSADKPGDAPPWRLKALRRLHSSSGATTQTVSFGSGHLFRTSYNGMHSRHRCRDPGG